VVDRRLILGLLGVLLLVGCDSASGEVKGGQSLMQATGTGCSAACTSPTWSCLYANCFGPTGQASCASTQGSCHQDEQQLGFKLGSFTCGGTKEDCWHSLVFGPAIPCFMTVETGADAGADAATDAPAEASAEASTDAASDASGEPGGDSGAVIVVDVCAPDAGTVDPTSFPFYLALHQPPSSPDNSVCASAKDIIFDCNMPCGDPPATAAAGSTSPTCHMSKAPYTFTPTDLQNIKTWIAQGAQNN
jgi:hypothetical protein